MSVKIFISYSHRDEGFKDLLTSHFSSMKRIGVVDDWDDRKIVPGKEWEGKIKKELQNTDIVLLLISHSFIASDYCYDVEMEMAMKMSDQKKAMVIPIILKPCDWNQLPFGKLQALPTDGKPLSKWNDIDEGFLNVINGVKSTIYSLNKDSELF